MPAGQRLAFGQLLAERYAIREVIGEGGMGTVYRAIDRQLNFPCAVKVLHENLAMHEVRRVAFLKEARILMTLRHPNIVGVFNVEQSADVCFVVMELVEGKSLGAILEETGAFTPLASLDIIAGILDGMGATHKAGIIHRDLKPDNVLVTPSGDVRIIDFGIAKAPVEMGAATRTGVVMGTWGYMAPEQGDAAKNADARSDVYSIGATLWALCKGQSPHNLFMSEQDASILSGLPEGIATIVQRACSYNPDDRYQSAEEMLVAVRSAKRSIEERAPRKEPVVSSPIVRRPIGLRDVLIFAFVIMTYAVWATWEKRDQLFPATPTVAKVFAQEAKPQEKSVVVATEPKVLPPAPLPVVKKTPTQQLAHAVRPSKIVEQQKTASSELRAPKTSAAVKSQEPRLVHKPVKTAKAQSVVTISVSVENAETEDVVLYTRQKGGDAGWESTTMRGVNDNFKAQITAIAPGVEYYIDAKSKNGETLKSGSRATPYVIVVK